MTRSRTPALLLASASLLAASGGRAAASERFVQATGLDAAAERLAAACATATAPACPGEIANAAREAARQLVALARRRPELAAPLATRAADSGIAELRAAAADALAQPLAPASATPLLLELLDDPVPAVRAAALRALRGSNDTTVFPIVNRAGAVDQGDGSALAPEATPPAPKLGIALPADAVFLHFASDAADGQATWSTKQAPATLTAALAKKGRGPFTPDQFRAEIEKMEESSDAEMEKMAPAEGEMPTAEQMAQAMAMAQKMMAAMEANANMTPEQQAAAAARAAGRSLLNPGIADSYTDPELFGDPKLFIVQTADGAEVAVVVYADRALRRTGLTVHTAGR